MASHDSIRPEASTIHHGADASPEDGEVSASADEQQLVQAKTVIRGSSRAERGERPDQVARTPASVAKVLLGTRLNHFFLEEMIGGGGMGAVFRARDEQLDRVVAIKVIPFVGNDPEMQRRFRNEAQSAAKLDHPRIARVFDVGTHGEWHYIVFEYIRGTNIRDLVISGGVLRIDDSVFYTCQLAAALQHAADRGIVHRDIKPSNVLIGEEDKIKLVDMGLARSDNIELSEDMTASGVTLGTFDYISPEQARDPRDADLRSDIYSLGCTLYFMLTGQPPYPGGTMLQKLLSHGNAPPPDARELRTEVSSELMAVMRKMLAKNPEDRYQSAADLIADLREVAFRDGLIRTQAVGPVAVREPSPIVIRFERHAPWLVAVLLLILITGWLHLDSVASREDMEVPPTAQPLELAEIADPPVVPGSEPSGDNIQQRPVESSTDRPPTAPPRPGVEPVPTSPQDDAANDRPRLPELILPIASQAETVKENEVAVSVSQQDSVAIGAVSDHMVSLEPLEAGEPPRLIRVMGDVPFEYDRDIDGAALASDFAHALELAEQYEVDHLEIATAIINSGPVTINRDNLRITSTVSGGSVIVFQPGESITMERSNMISIGSNRIEIDGIHFVWKVPGGEINGGALFAINDNPLVRLTDCSLTVENPGLCEEVYAFDVVTAPGQSDGTRQEETGRDDAALPLVAIELQNVIVRGQIGMIHMDYAAELQLNWENGLLAISDRMIDTAGARTAPMPTSRPIQLELTRLTLHAPKGLLRMRVSESGAYPVSVDRFAQSSVFVVNSGTPQFEFLGLELVSSDQSPLQLRGTANAYDTDPTLADPMMTVKNSEGETEMTRLKSLVTRWPDEVSPRWSVYWSKVRRSDASPSRSTPVDYRQDGSVRSGFDEKLLPVLPEMDGSDAAVSRNATVDRAPSLEREL